MSAEKERGRMKPLVHYQELIACELGKSALLIPVDHPSELVSNTVPIMTSPVVDGPDESGAFETLNTRYARAPGAGR